MNRKLYGMFCPFNNNLVFDFCCWRGWLTPWLWKYAKVEEVCRPFLSRTLWTVPNVLCEWIVLQKMKKGGKQPSHKADFNTLHCSSVVSCLLFCRIFRGTTNASWITPTVNTTLTTWWGFGSMEWSTTTTGIAETARRSICICCPHLLTITQNMATLLATTLLGRWTLLPWPGDNRLNVS